MLEFQNPFIFKLMARSLYLSLFLVLAEVAAGAQTLKGTIKGKITAAGKPIEYAGVGLSGTSIGTVTGKDGSFLLKNVPFGTYQLQFHAIGFEKTEKPVTVHNSEVQFLSADLQPVDSQLGEVVVTGTLKESYTSKSPIKVEVYTPALFKKNPTPTVFEALQMVNGVQPQLN